MTVQKDVPLSRFTTFGVGGRAEYFVEAAGRDDIVEASGLTEHITVLGSGSNVLISDGGVSGLVLKIRGGEIFLQNELVIADAGTALCKLANFYSEHSFSGAEWMAGIPGCVGGAAKMNAGAFGFSMADCVSWVEVLRLGRIIRLSNAECAFVYRGSGFLSCDIIIRVALRYALCDKTTVKSRMAEYRARRNQTQPKGKSAGSVFRRVESTGISAGYYIDRAGLKGLKFGGAVVSERHANFILNTGGATARDIAKLIETVKNSVFERFGVTMEEEIVKIGEF